MSAHLRDYEFYSESNYICGKNLWQYGKKSVKEKSEKFSVRIADRHEVLKSYIPHSEEAAGEKRYHYGDHGSLRIVAVVYVYSRARSLVRSEKECVEAVENRMKLAQFSPFLKVRLDFVDISF